MSRISASTDQAMISDLPAVDLPDDAAGGYTDSNALSDLTADGDTGNQSPLSRYYSHAGIDTAQQSRAFFNWTVANNSAENNGGSSSATATSRLNNQFLDSLGNIKAHGKDGSVSASIGEARGDAHRITPELKARFEKIGEKYGIPPALLAGIASRETNIGAEFHGKTGKGSVLHGWSDFRNGSYQGFGIMSVDKKQADLPASERRELQDACGKTKMDPYSEKNIDQAAREFKNKLEAVEKKFPNLNKDAQMATAVSRYNGGGTRHAFPLSDRRTTGHDYANDTLVRARYYAQNWGQLAGGKTAAGSSSSTTSNAPSANTAPSANAAPSDSAAGALSRGQRGEAVKQLQHDLIKLGQLTAGQVQGGEGIFGPKTQAAVGAFQKNVGLPESGRLDDQTKQVMNAVLHAVKRGDNSNPKLIEKVQDKLVSLGYMTKQQIGGNAGTFGPRTQAALRKFQNDHDLPTTGRFGRLTYNALFNSNPAAAKSNGAAAQTPAVNSSSRFAPRPTGVPETRASAQMRPGNAGRTKMPETQGLSEAKKYDVYSDFVKTRGNEKAQKDLAAGKRVVLGLRQPTDTTIDGGRGKYDDRIVVMWTGKDGAKHVQESTNATTEPAMKMNYTTEKDANFDGKGDLGKLKEGTLEFSKSYSSKFGNRCLRPTRRYAVERDSNHDGKFDRRDAAVNKNKRVMKDDTMMLFHVGGGMTGRRRGTYSAGCQTMPPGDFNKFWDSLGKQKTFQYVLVNVG